MSATRVDIVRFYMKITPVKPDGAGKKFNAITQEFETFTVTPGMTAKELEGIPVPDGVLKDASTLMGREDFRPGNYIIRQNDDGIFVMTVVA
jgi:hypothetical protein